MTELVSFSGGFRLVTITIHHTPPSPPVATLPIYARERVCLQNNWQNMVCLEGLIGRYGAEGENRFWLGISLLKLMFSPKAKVPKRISESGFSLCSLRPPSMAVGMCRKWIWRERGKGVLISNPWKRRCPYLAPLLYSLSWPACCRLGEGEQFIQIT